MRPRSVCLRTLLAGAIGGLTLALYACVSAGPVPERGVPVQARPYLLPPTEGWEGELAGESAERLHQLYFALVERNDQLGALNGALEMSGRDPDLTPATVLEAEARYLGGRTSKVLELLGPVLADTPDYVAAAVLYGRAAEDAGRVVDAFAAYHGVRDLSGIAAQRTVALLDEVVDELADQFDQQLGDGRHGAAEETLSRLRDWAPAAEATRAATEALEATTADPVEQLASLRRMPGSDGTDVGLTRRRAELEITAGDPAVAVRLAEELLGQAPNDVYTTHLLERARFRWRLDLLPSEVKSVARTPEITRSEFAVLLYWLFPQIRYGRPAEARIATDVIDHPQREAIVRVINLGLLDVDPTVHRFEPDAVLERQDGLAALLHLIEMSPEKADCLEAGSVPSAPEFLCRAAAACGLLAEDGDCLPEASLSGAQALDLTRRTLSELGTE